ncbi:MAG TPA: DNA-directed RNA polymerase subunit beta, partial [Ktedonobacterales bacterium]
MAVSMAVTHPQRVTFAHIPDIRPMPSLIQIQLDSFDWFKKEGLRDLFQEISPIEDFTGKNLKLEFFVPEEPFGKPKYSEDECRDRDATFAAPLTVRARLTNKETGEIIEKDVFMGDFPLMTKEGTFIINGAERVVVSQLVRSPGVYFTAEEDPTTGRLLFAAKLIPNRGAWLEFETSNKNLLSVKIDRKRKIPITTLLRAVGYAQDHELLDRFTDVDTDPDHRYLSATLDRDPVKTVDEALLELYRKLRPGDPATLENARTLVHNLFFHPRRYDLGGVGRYKLNRKLGLAIPQTTRTLTQDDLVYIIRRLIDMNNGRAKKDDIDHLGNRRVRSVGELIQNQFRVGLLRMERVVKERMSVIQEPGQATPNQLINIRPVVAAMKEFFGGSQLSQFMDQTNPLSEITTKRRLSALGPGGLSRERAGFDVRDVHQSHYGRICPIETPEGPNIGLIGALATYGQINPYGFIETPYRKVFQKLKNTDRTLIGQTLSRDVKDGEKVIASANTEVDEALLEKLAKLEEREVQIVPWVSQEVVYLTADDEERFVIAQANAPLDEKGHFLSERISARYELTFVE